MRHYRPSDLLFVALAVVVEAAAVVLAVSGNWPFMAAILGIVGVLIVVRTGVGLSRRADLTGRKFPPRSEELNYPDG